MGRCPKADVTTYNNYYEFGTGKGDPSSYAGPLKTSPWTVQIDGLVSKPASRLWRTSLSP